MNPKVFKTLKAVAGEKDEAKKAALKAQTDQELARHFSDPAHHQDLQELSFDLLNGVWKDVIKEDITARVIEVKTVGLGEVDKVDEDLRGMRAYWQGKGGQILSDVLSYETRYMPREEQVTAIDMHADEITLQFWGPFDRLRTQAQGKLRGLPMERLVDLIQAAINATTGAAYYGTFALSTLTAAQVDSVVDEVAARSDGNVTVLGTRIAVRMLSHVGLQFGDAAQAQILQTGIIGVYKGYQVAQVENSEDFAGNFVLPNDEVWIVGQNAGRLTYYGEQPKVQTLQLPSFMRRWETARDAGMLLYGADKGRIGRIKFT